jgi:glutamate--cysteine ligase
VEELLEKTDYILNKSQLVEYFFEGIKKKSDFKLGIEFEKIGVNKNTFQAVPYYGKTGIQEFLKEFKIQGGYSDLFEAENLIGLYTEDGEVSLEPGSQLEFSTFPLETLSENGAVLEKFHSKTAELAEKFDINWLGYGIQPLSVFQDITIIPKKRYEIMTKHLFKKGSTPFVMMRETAGIQTAIDYDSEQDAMKKLRVCLGISPIITAMFANSPLRGGKLTEYKTYRAFGWLDTDNERCWLVSSKIFEEDSTFLDYTEVLLDVPMFFIERNHTLIEFENITFRQYLNHGYKGFQATTEDWLLHMTTFFPDIRLKNYIEIRCADCQKQDIMMAFPALIKGIMYNDEALNSAWELVKNLSFKEKNQLRSDVPKYGLNTDFKNLKVLDIAKELVFLAEFSIKNSDTPDDVKYLEKLIELISRGLSPADIIISNWNSSWSKSFEEFVKYSKLG